MKGIDWINSWAKGNKKEKYEFSLRLGRLTIIDLKFYSYCETINKKLKFKECSNRFRVVILNFGFELK